jgi:hypothetical protein
MLSALEDEPCDIVVWMQTDQVRTGDASSSDLPYEIDIPICRWGATSASNRQPFAVVPHVSR